MRIHRLIGVVVHSCIVVNCFQNTNFSEDSQVLKMIVSDFGVVNCFQNTNFSEDSQALISGNAPSLRCELLSEY